MGANLALGKGKGEKKRNGGLVLASERQRRLRNNADDTGPGGY